MRGYGEKLWVPFCLPEISNVVRAGAAALAHCWLALHMQDVLPALEGKGKTKGEGRGLAL